MDNKYCPKCHRLKNIVDIIGGGCSFCGFVFPPEKKEDIFDEMLNLKTITKDQQKIYKIRYDRAE